MSLVERSDLDRRSAINARVVAFSREVVLDDLLDPVFEEVAELDWAIHIPRLIDYWCQILLHEPHPPRPILAAHAAVHEIAPLRSEHFDRGYTLWVAVVDRQWDGPLAKKAKRHAELMAATLARRLLGVSWEPPTADEPESIRPVTGRTPTPGTGLD